MCFKSKQGKVNGANLSNMFKMLGKREGRGGGVGLKG